MREESKLVIIKRFLIRVREYRPGVMNERESVCSKSERVMVRVKLGGETAVLDGDVINVLSVTEDLKYGVPIEVVVDSGFTGHQSINNG